MRFPRVMVTAAVVLAWCSAALPGLRAAAAAAPCEPGSPSAIYRLAVAGREIAVRDESRFGFHTAAFAAAGPVAVELALPGDAAPVIRPRRHGVPVEFHAGRARFSLNSPGNYVVQAAGLPPLALFVTPPESAVPGSGDPDVLYFGPGQHEAGVIRPRSGQTIYLAPGALVRGRIEARGVEGVRLLGRGVLDAGGYSVRDDKTPAILFERCRDIRVEGIGVRGGTWWQTLFLLSEDIAVAHVNLLGVSVNTDGIDLDGVRNFSARDCFIRCEDDGFGWHALDARRNGEPVMEDCVAEDCVIWNTRFGNGLRIGSSLETRLVRNLTFRRIDVLEHAGAAIRSDHSDWALCENLRFEDFVDEAGGRLVEIVIARTRYSNDNGYRDERGRFRGLHFRNLRSPGGDIVLQGHDAAHGISDVTFDGCFLGDRPVRSRDDLTTNAYVTGLAFSPP